MSKTEIGKKGEALAEKFLRNKGLKMLCRNFRTPLGEIDLIFLKQETFVFVEVKTNSTLDYGQPYERVNARKQRQMIKAALVFLKKENKMHCDARFDVVSIQLYENASSRIEHIENAFTAEVYG